MPRCHGASNLHAGQLLLPEPLAEPDPEPEPVPDALPLPLVVADPLPVPEPLAVLEPEPEPEGLLCVLEAPTPLFEPELDMAPELEPEPEDAPDVVSPTVAEQPAVNATVVIAQKIIAVLDSCMLFPFIEKLVQAKRYRTGALASYRFMALIDVVARLQWFPACRRQTTARARAGD